MKTKRIFFIGLAFLFALIAFSLFQHAVQSPVIAASQPQQNALNAPISPAATNATYWFTRTSTNTFYIFDDSCISVHPEDSIGIPEDAYVYNIRVGVNISHTNRGDMEIHLRAPDGTAVKLIGQSASTADHFDVMFDPFSLNPPESPSNQDHNLGLPYYENIWYPENDMSWLYQKHALGDWTLELCDGLPNTQGGEIFHWTLELELGPPIVDLGTSYKSAQPKAAVYEPISYSIMVENTGAQTATNIVLTDPIPDLTTYVNFSLTCNRGNCSYDPNGALGPSVIWTGSTLPPNEYALINFSVIPNSYGFIENQAVISSTDLAYEHWIYAQTNVYPEIFYYWDFEADDGGFSGNNGWARIQAKMPPFPPRGEFLWATNSGSDYDDTHSSIPLSRVVDLTSIIPGTEVILQWWEWFALAPGDVGNMTINGVEVHPITDSSGDWQHQMFDISTYVGQSITLAWTIYPNGDENADLGWYVDDVSIHTAIPTTDLEIIKEASNDPAVIGESLRYTVTAFNHGPYPANSVFIHDDLPAGLHLNAITPMLSGTECWDEYQRQVVCSVNQMLPGEAVAVVIEVTPSTTETRHGDQIVNYAYIYSRENDPEPANNATSLMTTLVDTPITAPQVYSVTPESAVIPLTGKLIHIAGDNFTLGMSAFLGEYELQNVTRITKRRLEARVPNSVPPGTYDLTVETPGGESGSLLEAFTVLEDAPPTISAISPKRGLNNVPVSAFIQGTNFSPGIEAFLYESGTPIGALENVMFINRGLIRATVPISLPLGAFDLQIIDSRGEENFLAEAYTVLDPASADDLFAYDFFDLWMHPPSTQQGETPIVGVNVRRQGGQTPLVDVAVDYFRDAPSTGAGGTWLGQAFADTLDSHSVTTTTLTWTVGLPPGVHTLFGVIDIADDVPELDETNNVISRNIRILPSDPGFVPLQIDEFNINSGALTTNRRQVYLNVSASAAQPEYLLFIEYQYIQSENDWVAVARTDWLPYATAHADFAWKLHPSPGVHYLQAWVADAQGNIAIQPGNAFVNLLLDQTNLAESEVHIYRYRIAANQAVLLRLISISGDADLYIWNPDGSPAGSAISDNPYEELEFFSTATGIFQIEVEGFSRAEYRLEIIPLSAPTHHLAALQGIPIPTPKGRGAGINSTSPGENTGLPEVPESEAKIYLPIIFR